MGKRLIGVDGGGTKTDAVIADAEGRVLYRVIGRAASPTSQPFNVAADHVCQTLETLLHGFGGLEGAYDGFFAGISGGGSKQSKGRFRELFNRILPQTAYIANGSDSVNALSSGIGTGDGIILIAGTGSATFVRREGVFHQVGGWGHMFGNEGSGYMLGRLALMHALREWDGRGKPTLMRVLCEKKLGMPVHEAINMLYDGGVNQVATFAPLVFQACEQGDELAVRVLEEAAQELFECVTVAGRKLDLRIKPVVIAGGVIRKNNNLHLRLIQLLGDGYRLIIPDLPPVYGSVVEAARLCGLTADRHFKNCFAHALEKADTIHL